MEISPIFVGLVPTVIAITQFIKVNFGDFIPSRFIPLLAIGVGVVGSCLTAGTFSLEVAFQGVLVGLSAIGLFSGTRTTVQTATN